jgi:hypothetical protein
MDQKERAAVWQAPYGIDHEGSSIHPWRWLPLGLRSPKGGDQLFLADSAALQTLWLFGCENIVGILRLCVERG